MAIYPSPDKLDSVESKYALVIMAAKRARQIKDGARRLTDSKSPNPLTVALEEIGEHAIIARVVEDAAVTASQAALEPHEPSLEDIIGAGPVVVIDAEHGSTAAQIAALRRAEPDSEDDLVDEDGDEDSMEAVNELTGGFHDDVDEDEELDPPQHDDDDD